MIWDYAFKVVARDGEAYCGDAVYARVAGNAGLFALIDGLGHGVGAWAVAQRSLALLGRIPLGIGAAATMRALHDELRGTRGAVGVIVCLQGQQAELTGVGNITCRSIGSPLNVVSHPGVIGTRMRLCPDVRTTLHPGQRLILHSDGVSHRFHTSEVARLSPQAACDFILAHHRHAHDDASVLVLHALPPPVEID